MVWERWYRNTEEKARILSCGNMMRVVMLNGAFLLEIPFHLFIEGWVDFNKRSWRRLGEWWRKNRMERKFMMRLNFFFHSFSKDEELSFWSQAFTKLFLKSLVVSHGRKGQVRDNLHSLAWCKHVAILSWNMGLFFFFSLPDTWEYIMPVESRYDMYLISMVWPRNFASTYCNMQI